MVFMDTDGVVRKRAEPRGDDRHLYLLRDSTSAHNAHEAHDLDESNLYNGVGSIEVVKPRPELEKNSVDAAGTPVPDDDLAAARGIAASIVLGLGIWSLVAGLIGIFFI